MPRLHHPSPPDEIDELRARINRIDRADDIAEWRREIDSVALQLLTAARAGERNNLHKKLQDLIERMR